MHDTAQQINDLEQLGQTRFAQLPAWCGNEQVPGNDETERWRDWSQRNTTKDQARIEAFIAPLLTSQTRILHVGLGNSRFAERFCGEVALIAGITITLAEHDLAMSLNLPRYQPLVMNKYSSAFAQMPGEFDLIIDNNPSTFGCCRTHFFRMMLAYKRLLAPGGILVSDRAGLGHVSNLSNSHERWGFSGEDWMAVADALGMRGAERDATILTMAAG